MVKPAVKNQPQQGDCELDVVADQCSVDNPINMTLGSFIYGIMQKRTSTLCCDEKPGIVKR